jgi:hypothetical protein
MIVLIFYPTYTLEGFETFVLPAKVGGDCNETMLRLADDWVFI